VLERFAAEVERRPHSAGPLALLDRAECEDLLGRRIARRFRGGRWQPRAGLLDPVRLVRGLAGAAARRGAAVLERCAALAIEVEDDGAVAVRTTRGRVSADHAVVACNARTGALVPGAAGLLRPARGQMLATGPRPRAFRVGMAVDFGSVYWRQDADGVLTIGGCRDADPSGESIAGEQLNPRVQAALEHFLPQAFPGLQPLRPRHRWAGVMDVTEDGAPILGRVESGANIWVAAGFGGHGLPPALDAGEAIARAIADGRPPAALERLGPARLKEVIAA
jgi:gamma-glutamylputrescine oxidase